jgi:hypothetical protein
MASQTRLYSSDILHTRINQKAGSKLVQMEKFMLSVAAPDDRRLDKALSDDKTLTTQLSAACEKAVAVFVDACAKSVAAYENNLKTGKRSKPEKNRVGLGTFYDYTPGLEKSVVTGCGTVWQQYVTKHPELRAVRFKPAVIYPDFYVTIGDFESDKEVQVRLAANDEESAETLLREWSTLAKKMEASLKKASDNLGALPQKVPEVNKTIESLIAAYKAPTRESQQDDPKTDPEDEPDEGRLNEALFARFEGAIEAAATIVALAARDLGDAELAADSASKDAVTFLKKYAKTMTMIGPGSATKTRLERMTGQTNEVINRLVGVVSKTKATRKEYMTSLAILRGLEQKKDSALGLLERAKLSGDVPAKDFGEVLQLIKAATN